LKAFKQWQLLKHEGTKRRQLRGYLQISSVICRVISWVPLHAATTQAIALWQSRTQCDLRLEGALESKDDAWATICYEQKAEVLAASAAAALKIALGHISDSRCHTCRKALQVWQMGCLVAATKIDVKQRIQATMRKEYSEEMRLVQQHANKIASQQLDAIKLKGRERYRILLLRLCCSWPRRLSSCKVAVVIWQAAARIHMSQGAQVRRGRCCSKLILITLSYVARRRITCLAQTIRQWQILMAGECVQQTLQDFGLGVCGPYETKMHQTCRQLFGTTLQRTLKQNLLQKEVAVASRVWSESNFARMAKDLAFLYGIITDL